MAAGDYQGTYSADKVILTVGPVIVSGFTDGDFISAAYTNDRYTMKEGADGEVGRSKNPSKAGTVTLTLSATSASNDALSALFNLDAIGGVDAVIPISVTDLSGRTVIAASKAWLQTTPEVTFGTEVGDREWVFACADLLMFAGGNS